MKRLLSLLLVLTLASPLAAQVMPPVQPVPPKTPATKFKATASPTVKAGDHIVIDAESAKGDVFFFYDEVAFPKSRATLVGKKLILSTTVNGTYIVHVASLDDKAKEKFEVKVTGGEPNPNPPPDPPPTDPLESFRVEVRNGFAKIDARLTLLERVKPIPPPPPPPPPRGAVAHLTFVGGNLGTAPVINDAGLRDHLKASGIKVHVLQFGDPNIEAKGLAPSVKAAGGAPCVVLQGDDGSVIAAQHMTLDNSVARMIQTVRDFVANNSKEK